MLSPSNGATMRPLFGPTPTAPQAQPATRGEAILGILRGASSADSLLDAVLRGIAHPNALRDAVVVLAGDAAALEGFCRTIQKRLEASS